MNGRRRGKNEFPIDIFSTSSDAFVMEKSVEETFMEQIEKKDEFVTKQNRY